MRIAADLGGCEIYDVAASGASNSRHCSPVVTEEDLNNGKTAAILECERLAERSQKTNSSNSRRD